MACVNSRSTRRAYLLSDDALDVECIPGLAEWIALEHWRANWRPEPDPVGGTDELCALFQRVMRRGYAAYLAGAKVMPELFALDSSLASMWQEGFASARMDAAIGAIYRPACDLAWRT